MSTSGESSFAPPSRHWEYDVFLSFRGEDTRNNFTDHLYAALNQRGISTFIDGRIRGGEELSRSLFNAIEKSRFSIVILSINYASSTWCLDELVKILECMETMGQTLLPVFYDVDPSDVRKQSRTFKYAFERHKKDFKHNMDKVETWRSALTRVANLKGWHTKNYRHESEIIQEIVMEISDKLSETFVINLKNQPGMESRLQELSICIGVGSDDVRMIGIWGMGGIGKTKIARNFYRLNSGAFDGSCFLENVREISEKDGLASLQEKLLSQILLDRKIKIWNDNDGVDQIRRRLQHKKVLIVIDDASNEMQLLKLVGERDWFGPGSRIIITTRDNHLLRGHGVDKVYLAKGLNHVEALHLFSLKAFENRKKPSYEYKMLSNRVIKYADGLPLALEVFGSFLRGRTKGEWEAALERLETDYKKEIIERLQISFDGLENVDKKIFLDLACFFKGKNQNVVMEILESCGFQPSIGIRVLIERSLITISSNNTVWMHDLLQQMGREIVKRECPEEPGERSRLWEETDICHVLSKNTGTRKVEGIVLEKEMRLVASAEAFTKMINLRILSIHNVQLSRGLEYLSDKLRLMEWHGYPLKLLPLSLQLNEAVELNIPYSLIEELWKGTKGLVKLKSINLKHCRKLKKISDLTGAPNLKKVNLGGCTSLYEIHPSLLLHKGLLSLDLRNCTRLMTLPSKIHMESLEELVLSGCSKLKKFPEIVGPMESLSRLFLDGTAIKKLPQSVALMSALDRLNLEDCKNLLSLPNTLNCLTSLLTLNLSGCSKLENVPENLRQVESLEELALGRTSIKQTLSSIVVMEKLKVLSFHGSKGTPKYSWYLPKCLMSRGYPDPLAMILPTFSGLSSLRKLDLSDCNLGEGSLPNDYGCLFSLEELDLRKNNFVSLPASIRFLSELRFLNLEDCKKLQSLPDLPSKINEVIVNGCISLETLSNALKLCTSELSGIFCLNCLNLFDWNNMAFLMLQEYLKGMSNPRDKFSIVVPGSEFRDWFIHQNEGSSIRIDGPPDLHNNSKLVGYAVYAVFFVHKHEPVRASSDEHTHSLHCNIHIDGQNQHSSVPIISFEEKVGQAVSDHLSLLYLSRQKYFDALQQDDYNKIEFSFVVERGLRMEVKRCGVRPIYEQDMEELNKTMNQCSIPSFSISNESDQDYVGCTIGVTTAKRGLADTTSSGSGSCDDGPLTKRIRKL